MRLDECIFCQKTNLKEYLCSGDIGRARIISLAKEGRGYDDRADRILGLTTQELEVMKYHGASCYKKFQRDMGKKRKSRAVSESSSETCQHFSNTAEDEVNTRTKRIKPTFTKVCVICGSEVKTVKQEKVHKLLRVCEKQRAQKLLNAARLFQDRVHLETGAMEGPDDVFAADIFYHKYCCRDYFNKYDAKVEEILQHLEKEDTITAEDESLRTAFSTLELDFETTAYSITFIRNKLNETREVLVSNRAVKQLIIELHGDGVCFTYPTNKRISQMVFSTKSNPASFLESTRVSPVQRVASCLEQELKDYNFGLDRSFCDPRDLQLSLTALHENPPAKWEEFLSQLFKGKKISNIVKYVVFQILHYAMSGGKELTPFHVMVAEAVHSLTRSKELITALNHHGICTSYNTVRRIDVDLAERIIETAGNNRVPLPHVLETTSPLNGAMDNFDRNESTLAGTGSTHDTILVLFQNVPVILAKPCDDCEISTRPNFAESRSTVKLRSNVSCQELIRMEARKERGEVGTTYENSETFVFPGVAAMIAASSPETSDAHRASNPSESFHEGNNSTSDEQRNTSHSLAMSLRNESLESIRLEYLLWLLNRSFNKTSADSCSVPGFTAVRSTILDLNFHATTKILTPILPYPATTYDAILTSMINFQDALKQKGDDYGGLWADEGVYRIAKEIQLLKPKEFGNIFLGLGGFHMEKIVFACLGAFLEPSGIFSVLVETECYGQDTINCVISGSHYVRARNAHSMIHEVLISMIFEEFLMKYPEKELEVQGLLVEFHSKEILGEVWNGGKERAKPLEKMFQAHLAKMASQSQSFSFWNMYVSDLYPIARDLTNSMRSGDWHLFLSAVERATSLFFFFGRTNYSRWTPIFLQDCYQLKDKFPLLYQSYVDGGFVMNGSRKGSGVPFDQALEQCYNRPAKVSGGVIGVTRKKDAVALWNIIKHEKEQFVNLIKMEDSVAGELSVHHDFNQSTAAKTFEMVQEIKRYLQKVCTPLLHQGAMKNVLTGEIVAKVNVDKLLCCMKEGYRAYDDYVEDRLRRQKSSIHSTINRIKFLTGKKVSPLAKKVSVKDETIKALMYIEYGRHRGFTVNELLRHELTSSAFFLVNQDGYLRKSVKSQLGTELLKLCPEINPSGPKESPPTNAFIIDFMALVRKVPLKKLEPPVKTFHDLAISLTAMITNAACKSNEIHIVFDNYKDDSIKNEERMRRARSKEMVVLDLISPNQNVPVVLENFWASSVSKTAFQAFYVEWLTANYNGSKQMYLGIYPKTWLVSGGCASAFPRLDCTHEEADDRMMIHIQDILCHRSQATSITLLSGDTDVFVCLLYHFSTNWRYRGLTELWLIRNTGLKRSILPLHDICTALDDDLVKCRPALHALTGCDSTSKVSTKLSALNIIRKQENRSMILNFDSPHLTDDAIQMAESFLVKCLKPSTNLETFDELRLAEFDNSALKIDFEKTACTSTNIRKHIQRSYYQAQLWIQAPFRDAAILMNAESYGYTRVNDLLVPEMVITKPEELPDPCKCGKCARKNVCPCRVARIKCCKYCKCKATNECRNPITE